MVVAAACVFSVIGSAIGALLVLELHKRESRPYMAEFDKNNDYLREELASLSEHDINFPVDNLSEEALVEIRSVLPWYDALYAPFDRPSNRDRAHLRHADYTCE